MGAVLGVAGLAQVPDPVDHGGGRFRLASSADATPAERHGNESRPKAVDSIPLLGGTGGIQERVLGRVAAAAQPAS
jgi:hypothetical protein